MNMSHAKLAENLAWVAALAAPEGSRIKNFAGAYAEHVKAGSPMSTDEEVSERFVGCSNCPQNFFTKIDEGMGICTHTGCGCTIRDVGYEDPLWPNKLRWADQECPIKVWVRAKSIGDSLPSLPFLEIF